MHIELVIAKLVTVGLGLLITYQAVKDYRVHGDKPMLYVAVGFLLISVGAVIEGSLFDVVGLSIFLAGTIQTSIVGVGMIVILYSLYGRISTSAGGDES